MTGTAPRPPRMADESRSNSHNSSYQHSNTAILAVSAVEGPQVVTSAEFDDTLADTLSRLGLRPGLLQGLAGIHERRWWPEDVS